MSRDPSSFRATIMPLAIVGAILTTAALTGCGRHGETNAEASTSAPSASAAAANPAMTASGANASTAAPAASSTTASNSAEPPLAPTAAECPKLAAPQCPAPALASAKLPKRARISAVWSARRSTRHVHHHRMIASVRRDGHDQEALMGGPTHDQFAQDGYRLEDRTREVSRFESSGGPGWGRGLPPGCAQGCCHAHYDGRRIYREAGIDECGFLVWPGKVEY